MAQVITMTFESSGPAGGGHLRKPSINYRANAHDVQVTADVQRALGLRGGETIVADIPQAVGNRRPPRLQREQVETINDLTIDDHLETKPFEDLTAIDPEQQLFFETPEGPSTMRIVDLMTPIGLGQRGLIVAPPRTGKTILLQQMAHGVATNHPDVYVMVLLIDERPEEVTDMRRNIKGEVVASSNDQNATSHMRLARLMIEKAKRLVESGRDVFVLLDSLTRLGRAFNSGMRGGGRIMSGGLDINALHEPKAIFGAARNAEDGGSLTIIASALIDTGSRMDEVIFNEFKGTGNMEIVLSRDMANRRLWPAIDLNLSGTRKEERLLSKDALAVSHHLRRTLHDQGEIRSMELLLEAMERHPDNASFVKQYADRPMR